MRKIHVAGMIPALLVLLYVYAASSKLFDLTAFRGSMYIQPVPHWLANILVWLIPVAELVTAFCLIYRPSKRIGLYASLGLMTVFTGYVGAVVFHFFNKTPCSCGGVFGQLDWQQHLWVNLGFLLLTVLALVSGRRKEIF